MARLEQELLEKHEQELKEHVRSNGVGMCSSEVVSEVKMGAWGAVGGGGGGGREREDEEGWKTVSDDDKPVKKSRAQRRKVSEPPHPPQGHQAHIFPRKRKHS